MRTLIQPFSAAARTLVVFIIAAFLLALTACTSSDAASDSSSSEKSAGSENFPITFEHAFGETTIEDKPQRVVTMGWITHDIVAALGVTPVGVPETWGGDDEGFSPWFRTQVTDINGDDMPEIIDFTDGPDFEQILALEPDVILASHSGITENEYNRLAEIAPTLAYTELPWQSGSWQDLTTTVASAIGEQDAAASLIADTNAKIAQATAEHPEFVGTSLLYSLTLSEGSTEIAFYTPSDPRVAFLREFGFVDSPSVIERTRGIDAEDFYGGISLEELDTIDTDVFIAWSSSEEDNEYTLNHPTFSRWEPIVNGNYYLITDSTLAMATNGPSPISITWAIDNGFIDDLASTVAGDPVIRDAQES